MSRPVPEDLHLQLVAIDHECLFGVVMYAYDRVRKGADRTMLHRAVLSLNYRADPDEVNRLRGVQNRLRELGAEPALVDDLEDRIRAEHGEGRSARELAALDLNEVRRRGVRWSSVGKRGAPIRISSQLIGLLARLYPKGEVRGGLPDFLTGTESPEDRGGDAVFRPGPFEGVPVYRPPEAVRAAYEALSFVDRPTLDEAIDAIVGDGPDAEETATWLENDFEALTARYELAAAKSLGIEYRYS